MSAAAYSVLMSIEAPESGDCAAADDATVARRIVAAGRGTRSPWHAELYRRFAPRVRLYGLRHLREEQAAQDLAHDVLITVLEALHDGRLREPERIGSFVLGTARNVAIEWQRRGRRRERLLGTFGADLTPADAAPALELDHERLRQCLERLAERERSVLLLTFYDDLPAGEVASELGMSEGNVRVVRHRALGRLRDCMHAEVSAP